MAPRTGPRVKVISPNSGTVTTLSRSVSVASSVHSSGRGDGAAGQSRLRRFAAASVTPPPPPASSSSSAWAVLRAVDVNATAEPSSATAKSHRVALDAAVAASTEHSRNNGVNNRSVLPDFFAESQRHHAGRQPRPQTPSLSTSRSRRGGVAAASLADDAAAVRRAQAALEHAGDAVLRRPFARLRGDTVVNTPASTALGGDTSSLPPHTRVSVSPGGRAQFATSRPVDGAPPHRGMRLPPTIPVSTRARSAEWEESEEEAEASLDDDARSDGNRGRSHKRTRAWADPIENAAALARRRHHLSATATAPSGSSASSPHYTNSTVTTEEDDGARRTATPPATSVCPGMFSGVSAIPLDPKLFAEVEHRGFYHNNGITAHDDISSSSSSAIQSSRGATVRGQSSSQRPQQRYCVRPLWSLVGTFKTSLSGLVAVDSQQGCLHWLQRNPKGGQQCIKVPLTHLVDVFTTRVVQEDACVEERQYTAVVRTSTRPSQVVFGFATAAEANHLRNALKRQQ